MADLGCGPGNSTALLRARWPEAEIDAIDFAPEMLADARKSGVDARFIEADIATWTPDEPYDVIYSNAALQWLGDHETLLPRLLSFVRPGGVLAVQVPRNFEEHCHVLLRQAVADPRWRDELKDVRDWWNVLAARGLFRPAAPGARHRVDLWETRYFHVLEGKDPVFHWMMGTGLRPFAAALKSSAQGRVFGALPRTFGRRLSTAPGRPDHSPLPAPVLRGLRLDIVVFDKSPSRSGDPPWRWSSRLLSQRGVRGRPQ